MNTNKISLETLAPGLFSAQAPELKKLNTAIYDGFQKHKDNRDIKRTHLFNGRYENIYLDDTHIKELGELAKIASQYASQVVGITNLDCGYWFNDMPPDAITLPHSHDDDDEKLSAVYYVNVPDGSGDLIIHSHEGNIQITPEAGQFIFFAPDVVHEVTENRSSQHRLSIGMNFGVRKQT